MKSKGTYTFIVPLWSSAVVGGKIGAPSEEADTLNSQLNTLALTFSMAG